VLIVDLIVIAVVLAAAAYGFWQGLNAFALALIGFGVGAIIGSRLAPLALDGGYEDTFAPAVALPAALLCGALLAAAFERLGFGLRRHIRLRGKLNAVGGALLAGCLALIAVWIVGALAARSDDLRGDVRDSEIIDRLNAALPPPGPLLEPKKRSRLDPLPRLTGPRRRIGSVDPTIKRDPQVRSAAASVVKIHLTGCGDEGTGSGWIARDGIVVTNAHVVRGAETLKVQPRGNRGRHEADVIWFDEENDVAVMRVPGARRIAPLKLGPDPKKGTYAAALGYPGGGPYTVRPARTGAARRDPALRVEGRRIRGKVVHFRARGTGPGSSGGPIIDRLGRVRTMVFAGRATGTLGIGVPTPPIRRALRGAGAPVEHGDCT
jgi:hypothetical protein